MQQIIQSTIAQQRQSLFELAHRAEKPAVKAAALGAVIDLFSLAGREKNPEIVKEIIKTARELFAAMVQQAKDEATYRRKYMMIVTILAQACPILVIVAGIFYATRPSGTTIDVSDEWIIETDNLGIALIGVGVILLGIVLAFCWKIIKSKL